MVRLKRERESKEPLLFSCAHTLSKQISTRSWDNFLRGSDQSTERFRPTKGNTFVCFVSDSFSCHNKRKSDLCNANPTTELVHSSDVVFSIYKSKSLLRYCYMSETETVPFTFNAYIPCIISIEHELLPSHGRFVTITKRIEGIFDK